MMPAFNEELGIKEFLSELEEFLGDLSPKYIVVNDGSTDGTSAVLNDLTYSGFPLSCHTNTSNFGHGYSTLLGLNLGLLSSNTVLIVDGAGRFKGSDVRQFVDLFLSSNYEVGEGIRIDRHDPFFRQFVSFITRILLLATTGKSVRDPNTPLRIYNRTILESLVSLVSPNSLIPNLEISTLLRKRKIPVLEFPIKVYNRRGGVLGFRFNVGAIT